MIRSVVLSATLIASSAVGALALSAIHQVSYDFGTFSAAQPEEDASFVIPAFATVRDMPLQAIAPIPLAPREAETDAAPVLEASLTQQGGVEFDVVPVERLIKPKARPPAIKARTLGNNATTESLMSSVRPPKKRTERIIQTDIPPLMVSRNQFPSLGLITTTVPDLHALAPDYVIGVYR